MRMKRGMCCWMICKRKRFLKTKKSEHIVFRFPHLCGRSSSRQRIPWKLKAPSYARRRYVLESAKGRHRVVPRVVGRKVSWG